MCKLGHCGLLFLNTCTPYYKLLIDQFLEGNYFIHTSKGITGIQSQFCNRRSGIHVKGSGSLGRSHHLFFIVFQRTTIIKIDHGIIQSGIGVGKLIRNVQDFLCCRQTAHSGRNSFQLTPQAISGGGAISDPPVESVLLVSSLPDIFFNFIKGGPGSCQFITGFTNGRSINRITGSPLHGFKAVQHNVHSLVHCLKGGGYTIIKGDSGSNGCQ